MAPWAPYTQLVSKHPPRPRKEPIDIPALHHRTMRRYPITMARLRESELAEEAAKKR
jgi:hypothetical protein